MWLILFLIVMFSAKAFVTFLIFKELFKPNSKEDPKESKRAVSAVRSKFEDVNQVKGFQEWREYIRVTLLEMEIHNTLKGDETKVYHLL